MYFDCNEIKLVKMDKNLLRNNLYVIDFDGVGGVFLFFVYCDFKINERIGIIEVGVFWFFVIFKRLFKLILIMYIYVYN